MLFLVIKLYSDSVLTSALIVSGEVTDNEASNTPNSTALERGVEEK